MSGISTKWFLTVYAILLCGLAPLRHLWMDEWLQLSDTYHERLDETAARAALDPGGVPLIYLLQNIFVNHLGHTLYSARLLSILFAIFGLAGFIFLARLLRPLVDWQWIALAYALLPITLRYAVEVRQYGPALAFSIWATALLITLGRFPTIPRAILYGLLLVLAVYSHPFTACLLLAHAIWAFKRPVAPYVLPACALAALSFLPWYRYAHNHWAQAFRSPFDWRTLLVVVHELTGGGYPLTIPFLALAIYGYRHTLISQPLKRLLLLCIFVPFPIVLFANILFHYFFAVRQLLFIVPPLCVLAVEGLRALPKRARFATPVVLALIAIDYDFRWFAER